MSSNLPIGTIVPFSGGSYSSLSRAGWLLCNGQQLDPKNSRYQTLFDVIGTTYGGSGNLTFNLPDLQGLFVRGVDDGSGHDPDVKQRVSSATQAVASDTLGSVQPYATQAPKNAFTADIPHLPDENHKGNVGSLLGDQYSDWNGDAVTVTVGGGDKESRPTNLYVNFLIKYADSAAAPGVPVGALVACAGQASPGGDFLLCDGSILSSDDETNWELYDAIGTASGGDGTPYFNLPDCRGRFLRGVANNSPRDPDKSDRQSPQPKSGNSGNLVGSVQDFASGTPITDFNTSIPNVPTGNDKIDHIGGRSTAKRNSDSVAVNLATGGGDKETRPVNVYVNWYIRAR